VDNGLPEPQVTQNSDGTKTVVFFRINPDTGRKIKVTQKVKEIKVKERVNHAVAERKKWAKYGLEKGRAPGPDLHTTAVGDNINFRLGIRATHEEAQKEAEERAVKDAANPSKKFVCRTCGGEHFTAKCPYKGQLGPADPAAEGSGPSSRLGTPQPEGAAPTTGGYVPPHQRGKPGTGLSDPGRVQFGERDDSATLRVSNLSEDIYEDDLRSLFSMYGRVVRCHLPRDRDTGRVRGFAFVAYETREMADVARQRLNGYPMDNLIMSVEFSKR
jgi:translation initiation factor 3 subunit G